MKEALEEHKGVKTLLSDLSSMNDGSEVFDAKVKELQDEMSQEQINELGSRLQAAKGQA